MKRKTTVKSLRGRYQRKASPGWVVSLPGGKWLGANNREVAAPSEAQRYPAYGEARRAIAEYNRWRAGYRRAPVEAQIVDAGELEGS